jgi:hypothetical protein
MRTSRMPAAYTLPALALALSLSIPAEAGFTRLGRGGSSRDSGPAVRGTLKQPYVDAKGAASADFPDRARPAGRRCRKPSTTRSQSLRL